MKKRVAVYVLRHELNFGDSINWWGRTGRWPHPNQYEPKVFMTKWDAEEFLFDHAVRKKHDVKKWRPYRLLISKTMKENLYKGVRAVLE